MADTGSAIGDSTSRNDGAAETNSKASTLSVSERIYAKKELLERWLSDGIPEEEQESFSRLPTSLASMRDWEEPNLRIFQIGSPNAFLKSNPSVARIAELLTALRRKYNFQGQPRRKWRETTTRRGDLTELHVALQEAASRWQMERECRLSAEERLRTAEAQSELSNREAAQHHRELKAAQKRVAELERALRLRDSGLRVIE